DLCARPETCTDPLASKEQRQSSGGKRHGKNEDRRQELKPAQRISCLDLVGGSFTHDTKARSNLADTPHRLQQGCTTLGHKVLRQLRQNISPRNGLARKCPKTKDE